MFLLLMALQILAVGKTVGGGLDSEKGRGDGEGPWGPEMLTWQEGAGDSLGTVVEERATGRPRF